MRHLPILILIYTLIFCQSVHAKHKRSKSSDNDVEFTSTPDSESDLFGVMNEIHVRQMHDDSPDQPTSLELEIQNIIQPLTSWIPRVSPSSKFENQIFTQIKDQLSQIANENDDDSIALYNLASIHRKIPQFRNLTLYRNYILQSALKGNPRAQRQVGWLTEQELLSPSDWAHATKQISKSGHTLSFKSSPPFANPSALSLSYYYFSALGGDPYSQMILGHRHLNGLHGAPKNCDSAATYYKLAAASGVERIKKSRKHVITLIPQQVARLSDEKTLENRKQQEDVLDFYQYSAKKGVSTSQVILGLANLYGIGGIQPNPNQAREFFEQAIQNGEADAYGPLGQMYLDGLGVEQDYERALQYFVEGAEQGDAGAQHGLGVFYYNGHGPVERDLDKAFLYFNQSASQGNSDGQYHLGLLYLHGEGTIKNYKQAYHYMTLAAHQGQSSAQYHLGLMHLHGLGTAKSCTLSVKFFKHVSEKAYNRDAMEIAFSHYNNKYFEESLFMYHQLAETGDEIAQSNTAYLFDKLRGSKDVYALAMEAKSEQEKLNDYEHFVFYSKSKALQYYQLASNQGNVDALVKVGDFYYYGIGTPVDFSQAVAFYRKASNLHNAQATFNLGYMHENALGLPQDYFLAKRFYDLALTKDDNSWAAVYLALSKLYARWGFKLLKQRLLGGVTFPMEKESATTAETSSSSWSEFSVREFLEEVLSKLKYYSSPEHFMELFPRNDYKTIIILSIIFLIMVVVNNLLQQA